MKYTFFLILYLFLITPIIAQRLVDLEDDCLAPTDTTDDRYNLDNKIYQSNKEFIFDYTIFKDKNALHCQLNKVFVYGMPWILVPKTQDSDPYTIYQIGIAVLPHRENNNQTRMCFQYYNQAKEVLPIVERTGLIENDKNIWLHPPRTNFFAITEFNSFPFIKQPYKIGTTWKSGLTAGYFEEYLPWGLKWKGVLITKETLSIIDVVELTTPFGVLPCYVVEGFVKSDLTDTRTLFYFNETYGFVKIVYDLFDKTRLELNLVSVR